MTNLSAWLDDDPMVNEIQTLSEKIRQRRTQMMIHSYLFLAWLMGQKPDSKIIQATHTGELAQRFGRKVRNLMDSEEYKQIFPEVLLAADSKAAGRWETNKSGEYFAAGVGGAMTGRGADFLVIDDPHSEQDALSETAMENCYDWYTAGPRQRLQPGGRILRCQPKELFTASVIDALTRALKWRITEEG